MADHAQSDDPAVQAQLDRLAALSPGRDILGLERITALLDRIGNPQLRLPPVFHVAGTNGKGSTCAVLRAALEGDGKSVHVYSSPHLVRFNERIRLAGSLIDDAMLAHYLSVVLDIADGIEPSFFEVTTAAAFLAFSEHHADATIIEVGLGGRLDATNVIPMPAACGIAQLGIDHESFLGTSAVGIAREKAGVARPLRPLVTMDYPAEIRVAIADVAERVDAPLFRAGREWNWIARDDQLKVIVDKREIAARLAALPGEFQNGNAALALAMLMVQTIVPVSQAALELAPERAVWPARLQTIAPGPLTAALGDRAVTVDGAHNLAAAEAIARHLRGGPPPILIIGMLANKDARGWIDVVAPMLASAVTLPIEGHEHHSPSMLARFLEARGVPAVPARNLQEAIAMAAAVPDTPVLIAGSLYLAGEVLSLNDQAPV